MQKLVVWLVACASLLISHRSFALEEIRVVGTTEHLQIELSNATVENALAALRSTFELKCQCSGLPERRVTGTFKGNMSRVLSRLLDGYDYVIKTSPSGAVDVTVLGANASLQSSANHAASPPAVVFDEVRGKESHSLPRPGYAPLPATAAFDETRGGR